MICHWLRKLRKRRMRPISDITDRVPIGYFYDGQSKKVDVLPTVAFFNLFASNTLIPPNFSHWDGSYEDNAAASLDTRFDRIHQKADSLRENFELLMISLREAGLYPTWTVD
jgi:hypothetical protein